MARSRKNIIILSVFYLISRCLFLTRYPMFNDEAIYLREAWIMTHVPHQLWYSLTDTGKQPLLFWLYGFAGYVIADPVLAGRLVSVLIGLSTVWAVYLLGGTTAAILLIAAPMFIFFDRLALVDSALAAIFAWLLVFLARLRKQDAIRTALFCGILVGISLWVKSVGFLFGLVTVVEFLCIWYSQKKAHSILVALVVFIAVASWIGFPLFLRPESRLIFETAHQYTYSLKQLIALKFVNVGANTLHAFLDYVAYVSPVVVLAAVASLWALTAKKRILITSWLVTVSVSVIFGISIHARYILFTAVPVIVLSSFVLASRKVLLGITIAGMGVLSAMLIADPPAFFHVFPFPQMKAESYGYVDGWPSGYGTKEAFAAINADRKGEPAIIAIRFDSGNPEDAMFVYAQGNSRLSVKYLDPRQPEARAVFAASRTQRVYFVTRQGQYNGFERYLVPMGQFLKPGGKDKVELFRVRI